MLRIQFNKLHSESPYFIIDIADSFDFGGLTSPISVNNILAALQTPIDGVLPIDGVYLHYDIKCSSIMT